MKTAYERTPKLRARLTMPQIEDNILGLLAKFQMSVESRADEKYETHSRVNVAPYTNPDPALDVLYYHKRLPLSQEYNPP